MSPDQSRLLKEAIAGDAVAFDALIGPLVELGFRLAASMLGSKVDAEDAVQEATIKAWRNLQQLKDGGVVRSWFLSIVANQCRSVRRGGWWSVSSWPSRAAPRRATSGPEHEAVERTDLRQALHTLEPDDRLALYLRYMVGSGWPCTRFSGSCLSSARSAR